jgi:hypothetical protein
MQFESDLVPAPGQVLEDFFNFLFGVGHAMPPLTKGKKHFCNRFSAEAGVKQTRPLPKVRLPGTARKAQK